MERVFIDLPNVDDPKDSGALKTVLALQNLQDALNTVIYNLNAATPTNPTPPTPNNPPKAVITITGQTSLAVNVNATASTDGDGTITAYKWAWGDSTTDSGIYAAHTYSTAGTYTVSLTVTDDDGATNTATKQVSVTGTADRSALIPGTYKPDGSNTGLLPGWTTANLTRIDANTPGATRSYNSGANWPAFLPPDGAVYKNTWFHIPVWIIPGRKVRFENCLFDGYGIPNNFDTGASNYQAPLKSGATDWACLDLSAVGVSGAAGNVKTNVVLVDCKIDPAQPGDSVNGIRGCGFSLYRTKIVNVVDGIDLFRKGSNEELGVYIEASFVSSLAFFNTAGNHSDNRTHNDGIQWAGGHGWEMNGALIEGIAWPAAASGADTAPYYPAVGNTISVTSNEGPASGMNVHDSWLDGGAHNFIAIVTSNTATRTSLGTFKNVKVGRRTKLTPIQISQYMTMTSITTYEDNGATVSISRGES